MPLKLVTGPANSGRAGELLGEYRARLDEDPVLVVPAFPDVEHVLRELAGQGAVFGAEVVRFARLFDEIAERCGGVASRRRASRLQRAVLVEEAVRGAGLEELAPAAERAGFARAAVRLVAELERSMVAPERFERALTAWAGDGARGRYAREVAAIYAAYRERLAGAGLVDDALFAWRAVEALRERPGSWGGTPVMAYGFDDFTPIELEALETLAGPAGAPVVISLPYERGRAAFRAVGPVLERLATFADEHVELTAVADHYRPESRATLHHLERRLYEAPDGRPDPGDAVRLLSAGGERAEVELVAAEVLCLLREGTPAGQVAVVFRDPSAYASLVEQVFGAYGVPYSIDRWVPVGHTALGRGLLALLRCAGPEGTADDLLAYLRTPGLLDRPRLADRLEAEVRRDGARTAAEARRLWEKRRWRLGELDRLAGSGAADALLARVDEELARLFAASYRRRATIFQGAELEDPRVHEAASAGLRELLDLARAGVALDRGRVHDRLARLTVRLGEPPAPDRVQVASPEGIRARRFEAVFVCGLQEGEFPRPAAGEPFLSDDDRRGIAEASGLALGVRDDQLDRERHLFYVCASRPERTLYLSSRFADEEGNPEVGSFLVEEVTDLFDPALGRRTARRTLADVTWPPADAPTDAEWLRALALAGPEQEPCRPDGLEAPEVLEAIASRPALSAGALESFADCPVKWLVDELLRPDPLEPDPEPMVRGSYAHAVLELTYDRLRAATGSARVTEETLPEAERLVRDALREKQPAFRLSPKQTRVRTAVRRLEFDLLRHLRREAEAGGSFEPRELELEFGNGDGRPALRLEPEGVSVRGRIDRVDVWDGNALVRDYKSGRTAHPVAKWEDDNRLQVAIYMLAVRELLGLEPAGGVYVPLADRRGQPRGLLRKELEDELGEGFARSDMKEDAEVERQLDRARERVCELAGRMSAGEVRPCPESCAWNGGCSYPSICREEER
jgi:ATP-dependent helicase/DNAse subunit B